MTAQKIEYGGQAVIEGVMMRSKRAMAVAVRAPDGRIVEHSEPLNAVVYRGWIGRTPFVRGLTMLWDALVLGMRALLFSSEVAAGEEVKASAAWNVAMGGAVLVALALGILLFFVLPMALVSLLDRWITSALVSNLIEGLVRLIIVIGYIVAVGLIPDIRRVFAYHGAEHKTIHAYEAGEPLEVERVQRYPTAHARCGTAFLLLVVAISVLIFAILGRPPLLWRVLSRILLVPVIAGVAYEALKLSARYERSPWMRLVTLPGLFLQRLTTREPDDGMVEVAIAALKRLLLEEGITTTAEEDCPRTSDEENIPVEIATR